MLQAAGVMRRQKRRERGGVPAAFNSGAFRHKYFPRQTFILLNLRPCHNIQGQMKKEQKHSQVRLLRLILIVLMVPRKMTINSEMITKCLSH